ncbi:translation initiation factor IF-2-like [Mustela putorius furo]|uniref:Translation initiation factor IF-2-like n=1 Tax=Mustela putorius furo TaxID=9669 RepID=A0A8U0UZW6_MUSPF|nr:translation initiation factor IF-2-like [Mustela putorius furo]
MLFERTASGSDLSIRRNTLLAIPAKLKAQDECVPDPQYNVSRKSTPARLPLGGVSLKPALYLHMRVGESKLAHHTQTPPRSGLGPRGQSTSPRVSPGLGAPDTGHSNLLCSWARAASGSRSGWLRVAGCGSPAAGRRLRVAGCGSPAAGRCPLLLPPRGQPQSSEDTKHTVVGRAVPLCCGAVSPAEPSARDAPSSPGMSSWTRSALPRAWPLARRPCARSCPPAFLGDRVQRPPRDGGNLVLSRDSPSLARGRRPRPPPPGPPPRPPLTAGCGQAVPVVSLCQEAPPRSSGCGSQSIRKARVLATKHQSKANQLTENLQDECRQGPGAPHARLCGPERRGLLRFAPSAPSPEETVGLQAPGTRLVGASDPGAAAGNGPTRGAVAEGARGRCPRAGPPAARSARVTAVRLDPGADAAAAGRTHRRAGGARVPDEGPCRRGLRKTQGSVHAASYSPASTGGAELDALSHIPEEDRGKVFLPYNKDITKSSH